MSDPNEQSEATQQEAGSAQGGAESRVEATEAAERKAQELGVDLTNVEGTGSGGRVTAQDVENAQRQPDSARPTEALQVSRSVVEPKTPRDATLEQYVVLKATLAGPIDESIDPSMIGQMEQITLDDGSKTTVIVNNPDGSTTINFPTKAPNFFAPFPPIVEWKLPDPQPPIPADPLRDTNQPCRSERCRRDVILRGGGQSLLGPL
jgi:pyruvate/2-oxoglutarate dehydrogenase complex dihydrolipoamide acyltransferase (E2) component